MRYYKHGDGLIATVGVLELPELTAEEYRAELARLADRAKVQANRYARTRPLTEEEVCRLLITQQINTLEVDDETALRMMAFYPQWTAGAVYALGHKARHDDELWRCLQTHTAQADWLPGVAASLWERIDETHDGTMEDPIPYAGAMTLTAGLHYVQDFTVYRCIRDTGVPVHQPLKELVGLYVENVQMP